MSFAHVWIGDWSSVCLTLVESRQTLASRIEQKYHNMADVSNTFQTFFNGGRDIKFEIRSRGAETECDVELYHSTIKQR